MVLYYILLPLAWIVFHIGFRVECIGRENLKKVRTSGCIIAPNHVSAIDPVFVVITRFWGRRMVVFAKKELFEINVLLTWFFRWMGALCVRGTREELDVIDQTVEACRNGGTLLIFPEGTREKEGKLLPPKSGLFVIAAEAGVDVVPCRIFYDTPDGKMHLFCRVRVIYGEPMPAAQFAMESRSVIILRNSKTPWKAAGTPKNSVPTSRHCWKHGKRWERKKWRSVWLKRRGSASA